jgi:hypothetical protein
MKNKLICIAVFVTSLFIPACNLDEKAYSVLTPEIYFKSQEDANNAVIGIYHSLTRQHFWTDDLFSMVILPNKYVVTRIPAKKPYANFTFAPTDARFSRVWNFTYTTINRANTVIDEVSKMDIDETKKQAYIGEAKFLRALSYFNLVRLFGGVPLKIRATTNLDEAYAGRATVEEIYALIVQDLKDAEAGLPPVREASQRGRVTQCAAMTLLGKVYLTMAGYPMKQSDKLGLAVEKLQYVIDHKAEFGVDLLPNYADVFDVAKEAANFEAIFAIQFSHAIDQGSALAFFANGLNSAYATSYGQYNYGFTTGFYNLYEAADVRREITAPWTYKAYNGANVIYGQSSYYRDPSGLAPGKYRDGPPGTAASNVRHANDIPVLRYADVLLMYAEAENELNGASSKVYNAINLVRTRAQASVLSGSETTEEIRELVYIERLKELSGELHEYFDIQRLERLEDHVTNSYEARIAGVQFDPKQYLYPIPQDEIDVNLGIDPEDQNPGY